MAHLLNSVIQDDIIQPLHLLLQGEHLADQMTDGNY
jgi:hypothetical protein